MVKLYFGLLLLLSCLVALGTLDALDRAATTAIQTIGNDPLDWALSFYTFVGHPETSLLAVGALAWFTWKRAGPRAAGWLFGIFAGVTLLEVFVKNLIPHPGPPSELDRSKLHAHLLHVTTHYAFPSGHTFRTAFLAVFAARIFGGSRRMMWLCIGWSAGIGMAFARVYLGDHWATDVAGGLLLAAAGVSLARYGVSATADGSPSTPAPETADTRK